ncbi:MAG: hypothetical protein ACLTSZ_19315 [Lachnospiraceae bacterium]
MVKRKDLRDIIAQVLTEMNVSAMAQLLLQWKLLQLEAALCAEWH